jgi:fructose-1-phosphate kinase PfkB-like protein
MEPKAIVISLQNFELVSIAITEYKEAGGEGIQVKAFLHQHGKSIDRFAQIGRPASEINPFNGRSI